LFGIQKEGTENKASTNINQKATSHENSRSHPKKDFRFNKKAIKISLPSSWKILLL